MTTFAERLGQAHMNLERKRQAGDFIMLGKAIAVKNLDVTSPNVKERVAQILQQKTAVIPGSSTSQRAFGLRHHRRTQASPRQRVRAVRPPTCSLTWVCCSLL
jgi:hypothetical protein